MVVDKDSKVKTHWTQLNRNTLPEMMRHWYDVKKSHPDNLIGYRMGDFYEFFYDDAINVSRLLGLTLTNRGSGPNRHPLAGIPHKATQHFKSLIKQGQTVVIVEQLEDPKTAQKEKRIVKRGVIQILSPGTIIDDSLLDARTNNYLVSIAQHAKKIGVAFIDLSCGDFFCTNYDLKKDYTELFSLVARFEPVECIMPNSMLKHTEFIEALKSSASKEIIIKEHNFYAFQLENATQNLLNHFHVKNLKGFGIEGLDGAVCAAGAIIDFLSETQKTILPNITNIKRYLKEEIMFLDANTQKNLEILRNLSDGGNFGSLLSIIDKTITPMGSRLMKKVIVQPLLDPIQIKKRQQIVGYFKEDNLIRNDLREYLSEIGDMERIISRVNYSRTANARDLVYLKRALTILPSIKHILGGTGIPPLETLINSINDYTEIVNKIHTAIKDEPPLTITDGGLIRDGYDSRVDEMRDILNHGKDWILKFEENEKSKLNISTGFKIGFNRVLGYYIQITDNALKNITLPENYTKRQTLKGGTRYETEELKSMEIKILNADETIKDIEYEIFSIIRQEVAKFTKKIQDDAQTISLLDILCAFGDVAAQNDYCCPRISDSNGIKIVKGRHPVVEQINMSEPFIPNDCYMGIDSDQMLVITGPNWSGKSTYLRQVALITIMTQIGSYIPAESAEIGIVDRVFTRIGASDDLTKGQSTFMLEMNETAQILHYATEKSLVIIDELGRGTSTTDGKSIARAVMESLHESRIKTLFSTHFHELIDIPLSKMKNYHFLIKEEGNKLVFLRQLVPGGTDKSYGIHVAMMAGVPQSVVDRAFILVDTEYSDELINGQSQVKEEIREPAKKIPETPAEINNHNIKKKSAKKSSKKKSKRVQTFLFMPESSQNDSDLVNIIKKVDFDSLTPIEAMKILIELKEKTK